MEYSSFSTFLSNAAPFLYQIPSPLFSAVTGESILHFLYVTTFFWRQIFEDRKIYLQSWDDFEQLAQQIFHQNKQKSCSHPVSNSEVFHFVSPDSDKIHEIYRKCHNYNNTITDSNDQLQKIEEQIDTFNSLKQEMNNYLKADLNLQLELSDPLQNFFHSLTKKTSTYHQDLSFVYSKIFGQNINWSLECSFEKYINDSKFTKKLNQMYFSFFKKERNQSDSWLSALCEIDQELNTIKNKNNI